MPRVAAALITPRSRRAAMPAEKQSDYEVGYGKPPRHTRFKKGQSGNPRGRPCGSKNLKTLLSEALSEPVIITENGRSQNHQARSDRQTGRRLLGHTRSARRQNRLRPFARHRRPERAGLA